MILPTWDYGKGGHGNIFSWDWGTASTIGIFLEDLFYDDVIAKILLIFSLIVLIASAVLLFQKKKIKICKIMQAVAALIISIIYFLYHISLFTSIADYAICEMNALGFIVVVVCIADAVISFVLVDEKSILEVNNKPNNQFAKYSANPTVIMPENTVQANTSVSVQTSQLIEYKKMLDSGLITQEDFDKKKKQILDL